MGNSLGLEEVRSDEARTGGKSHSEVEQRYNKGVTDASVSIFNRNGPRRHTFSSGDRSSAQKQQTSSSRNTIGAIEVRSDELRTSARAHCSESVMQHEDPLKRQRRHTENTIRVSAAGRYQSRYSESAVNNNKGKSGKKSGYR